VRYPERPGDVRQCLTGVTPSDCLALAAFRAAGCAKVFSEKASGTKTDWAELRKAISRLGEGDVLMVTRLDRLARSTRDLLNTLDEITKRGAGFKSLADSSGDTTTPL
jgi:DNA invertase Pin-like site-specific DNA recombinase